MTTVSPTPCSPCEASPSRLRDLADRAARSSLVQRACEQMPSFASGPLSRTASCAGDILERMDGHLNKVGERVEKEMKTKEGEEVWMKAGELWNAMWGFVVAMMGLGVGMAERGLGVENQQEEGMRMRIGRVVKVGGERMEERGGWEREVWRGAKGVVDVGWGVMDCVVKGLGKYEGRGEETVRRMAGKMEGIMKGEEEKEERKEEGEETVEGRQ